MATLTMEDRDELRTLQDRFLALPMIARHIEEYGEDARMFQYERPTARDLKTQLWPIHREGFETAIRDYERENSSPIVPAAPAWKRGTTLSLHREEIGGPEAIHSVPGIQSGSLTIAKLDGSRTYGVRHYPSGMSIFHRERLADCKAIVAELRERFPDFDTLVGKLADQENLTREEQIQADKFRAMRPWIKAWKPAS